MGNYDELKQAISDVIKTNGNQEITGAILQSTLLSIVSTVGANATFAGIANPDTNPGTPDQNVFYITGISGTYINFGGKNIENNKLAILYNKNNDWGVYKINVVTNIEPTESPLKVNGLFINKGYLNVDTGQIVSSLQWTYTNPIHLLKGQGVIVYARGYDNIRPIIAKVDNLQYTVLVMQEIADTEIHRYTYIAENECDVVCFGWTYLNSENDNTVIFPFVENIETRLKKVENGFIDISNKFLFTDNSAIYANANSNSLFGKTVGSTLFSSSNLVNVSEYRGRYLDISVPSKGTTADNEKLNYGTCFYDENKEVINDAYYEIYVRQDKKIINILIQVPENAAYIKTTWLLSSDELGDFVCLADIDYQESVYDKLNGDELCSYYTVDNNGNNQESENYSRSSLYICKGCNKMDITIQRGTNKGNAICFYDENKDFICSYPVFDSVKNDGVQNVTLYIPKESYYCAFVYPKYGTRTQDFLCILYGEVENTKRRYQSGMINFSKVVNQTPLKYWDVDSQNVPLNEYDVTTGVLMLPNNYSENGNPVPLILYCHGASHYVYFGKWGATENFMIQKQHWLDMGFAVMDCNGPRDSNKTNITGLGSYASVDGYYKCFKYVTEHYNVEEKCCLVGGSAGGLNALNLAYWHSADIKSFVLLSAVTNTQIQNPFNTTFEEQFGIVSYEAEKMIGLNPIERIVTISEKEMIPFLPIPIYALIGSLEEISYESIWINLNRFINACRNAQQTAALTILSNLDHSDVVSGGNIVVDTIVSDYFKRS